MGKTFRNIKITDKERRDIERQRDAIRKLGITDPRLLSDRKVLNVLIAKANTGRKIIPIQEILRILQG